MQRGVGAISMSVDYLLDTNVLVYAAAGRGAEETNSATYRHRIKQAEPLLASKTENQVWPQRNPCPAHLQKEERVA